jgi:spermidine/putrescine transport system ATP-binding protein
MAELPRDPLVRFTAVHKAFGTYVAVKSLDLDIHRGEFLALMGPSGCGKTTTLRMLAGLEKPTSGTISIDGHVMNDVPPHQRDTPLVWQSLALFPFLSVVENVEFGLRMRGIGAKERRDRAMMWLDRMQLGGFETRRIDQLSGGQRQRVALARSLVTEPRMLLLDEPLSALDAHLVIRMQGVLTRLQRELGITFVYVTHSQSEAFAMADRVVIMGHGKIEQIGTPQEIFRGPKTRFVAEFVGRNNILTGPVQAGMMQSPQGPVPVAAPDGPAEVVVAADRVTVSRARPEAPTIRAAFLSEEFAGTGIICYFETPDGAEWKAQVTERQLADLQPESGQEFWLSWDPGRAHVMG